LVKIAQFAPEAFIAVIDNLADNFKTKLAVLKKGQVDTKKLYNLSINIKRLSDELKKVHEIDENPKFIDLNNEIVLDK
jgi:hypothetical protein